MSKKAVIIVDMQDFFLEKFPKEKAQTLIESQSVVLSLCASKNISVVFLEYKNRGKTIPTLLKLMKTNSSTKIVIKDSNGGFTNTNLDEILREKKVKNIILMGINASGCVQDTAIGAINRGYNIITAAPVIASNTKRDERLLTSRKWYPTNGTFFEDLIELLGYLKK